MKSANLNTRLIDSYLQLLRNLSEEGKKDFVEKFKQMMKRDKKNENKNLLFYKSFGALDSKESADEIIYTIKE